MKALSLIEGTCHPFVPGGTPLAILCEDQEEMRDIQKKYILHSQSLVSTHEVKDYNRPFHNITNLLYLMDAIELSQLTRFSNNEVACVLTR
jgi:hypothetical protein